MFFWEKAIFGKDEQLKDILQDVRKAAIAFSGGVFIFLADDDCSRMADPELRAEIGIFFLALDYQQVFLIMLARPNIGL